MFRGLHRRCLCFTAAIRETASHTPQVAEQKEIENIPSFYIIRMTIIRTKTIRITKITPQPNASEVSLNGAREVSLDWDDIVGESQSACYEKENAK